MFSVNPDPQESDPSQMEPKEVEGLIRGGEDLLYPLEGGSGEGDSEGQVWKGALASSALVGPGHLSHRDPPGKAEGIKIVGQL